MSKRKKERTQAQVIDPSNPGILYIRIFYRSHHDPFFLGQSGSIYHENRISAHRVYDPWRRRLYGGPGGRCHASGRILCPCHCPHMENKLRNNQDLF